LTINKKGAVKKVQTVKKRKSIENTKASTLYKGLN